LVDLLTPCIPLSFEERGKGTGDRFLPTSTINKQNPPGLTLLPARFIIILI